MEIDIGMVRDVFLGVLDGKITREYADRWAYKVIQQAEARSLVYLPAADEERIWAGIMYLYGVDLMEEPGLYLHTEEEIRMAMHATLGLSPM